jgi:hypothetical protein
LRKRGGEHIFQKPSGFGSDMVKRAFHVTAVWDDEAQVYVADSDVIGLHIETSSIDEFEEIMLDVAPELIVANHLTAEDIAGKPYKDLVPAIFWQRPVEKSAA